MSAIGKLFTPKVPKAPDATPLPDTDNPEIKAAEIRKRQQVMQRLAAAMNARRLKSTS